MSETGGSAARPARGVRLSRLVFASVMIVALLGVLYLLLVDAGLPSFSSPPPKAYVASRDLPALHQIRQEDVREALPSSGLGSDPSAITERDALVGRYTLTAVSQDVLLGRGNLGPVLPVGAVDLPIVAIPATFETTLAGRLQRGDSVRVLLPVQQDVPYATVEGVVLDIGGEPNPVVLLAVPREQVDTISVAVDLANSRVIRIGTYSGP